MKIRLKLPGGIAPEKHKMYILSYKLTLLGESAVKIRLKLCHGI